MGIMKIAQICSLLVFAIALTTSDIARSQSTSTDTFTVNLTDVDIHTLIDTVSKRTGRNFIVDPRVKASVTVISSSPIDANQLYDMFLSVLDVHGFAAVHAGSFIKIVPLTNGVQSAVPVLRHNDNDSGITRKNDRLVTEVIHIKNSNALDIVEIVRPLISEAASISADATLNVILITERAENAARLEQLIQSLDKP